MNQSNQSNQPNIPQEPQQPQPSIQPEMPQKSGLPAWAIVLITIAAVVLVGAVSYSAYRYFTPEPIEEPSPGEEEVSPGVLPINEEDEEVVEEPSDEFADWQTYRNEEYGFEITLTDAWKGYRVVERGGAFSFLMPIPSFITLRNDSEWLFIFDLIGIPKSEWERRQNEGPPTPTLVAENDFYVFGYRIAPHDLPPEEMDLLEKEKDILEIYKVISTFKFIE